MKYVYKLTEETISDDDLGSYKTYGIECVDKSKGAVLYRISDVSTSRKRMTAAVDMFNSMGVSLIHIPEILSDMIGSDNDLKREL